MYVIPRAGLFQVEATVPFAKFNPQRTSLRQGDNGCGPSHHRCTPCDVSMDKTQDTHLRRRHFGRMSRYFHPFCSTQAAARILCLPVFKILLPGLARERGGEGCSRIPCLSSVPRQSAVGLQMDESEEAFSREVRDQTQTSRP
jgi:hypothetical protein